MPRVGRPKMPGAGWHGTCGGGTCSKSKRTKGIAFKPIKPSVSPACTSMDGSVFLLHSPHQSNVLEEDPFLRSYALYAGCYVHFLALQ